MRPFIANTAASFLVRLLLVVLPTVLGVARVRAQEVAEPLRPSLGIFVTDVTEQTRIRYRLVVPSGAVITQIRAGGPAALVGLPLGGVIVSLDGKRIGSASDLLTVMQTFRPGDLVEVTYFEGDRIGRKMVRLTGAPAAVPLPMPREGGPPVRPEDPPLTLGRRPAGDRPILDALERTLDRVLPPGGMAEGLHDRLTPPPDPDYVDPSNLELPPPPVPDSAESAAAARDSAAGDADELTQLRRQLEQIERQVEALRRRIEQLERARTASDS